MFGIGYQELLLILLIGLIFFGAGKLPKIARSMGRSVQEFKKGMDPNAKDEEEEKSEIAAQETKKEDKPAQEIKK